MSEKSPQFVKTDLRVKASASLAEEIEGELAIPDPSPERAFATLRGKRDSQIILDDVGHVKGQVTSES